MKLSTPSHLKSILREYDTDALCFQDDIVIQRILQFGELEEYKQLKKKIGRQTIIDYFLQHRQYFDKKTINFWEKIFHLPHLPFTATSIYEKMHNPTFRRSIR
jgi:hypothetical protein